MTSTSAGKARQVTAAGMRAATEGNGGQQRHATARGAAVQVIDRHTLRITLPDTIGTVRLPEPQRLAFYGGLVALAAFGIVEWPVAAVLGIGHLLADDHHHKLLCEFGAALEEA